MNRLWAAWMFVLGSTAALAAEPEFTLQQREHQLEVRLRDRPLATYVFRDREIRRPYYHSVRASDGTPVTRTHPPREGVDAVDHATMHPGIWLAFGDVGGVDFWRNKGLVEHMGFERVEVSERGAAFTVRNQYRDGDRLVCTERGTHRWRTTPAGVLLELDSQFEAEQPVAFGDQEEMGLGVRLATPLVVRGGAGRIVNSEGRENEAGVWGRTAAWCDYAGSVGDRRVGVAVLPHPENFRGSWFHVRDYGLLVANPFGRKAFTKGDASRVEFGPDRPLRLRFAVLIHAAPAEQSLDFAAVLADYVRGPRGD